MGQVRLTLQVVFCLLWLRLVALGSSGSRGGARTQPGRQVDRWDPTCTFPLSLC